MVLFVIGLGLGNEKDISVKGLEAVKSCSKVFLEYYTSLLSVDKKRLESFYGVEVIEADRNMVEIGAMEILEPAKTENVAFLVVGDPFGATTHTDLILRAKELNIKVEVIHNASIMNAIGCVGLQLYQFGQTISVPFWTEKWKPGSFYEKIQQNLSLGLHTLCLLDIKVKEQTEENLMKGNNIFEPPRFMTVNECVQQLLELEETKQEGVLHDNTLCIGVARIGQTDQQIEFGTIKELANVDFGKPLHSFIICGKMHSVELEYVENFRIKK